MRKYRKFTKTQSVVAREILLPRGENFATSRQNKKQHSFLALKVEDIGLLIHLLN